MKASTMGVEWSVHVKASTMGVEWSVHVKASTMGVEWSVHVKASTMGVRWIYIHLYTVHTCTNTHTLIHNYTSTHTHTHNIYMHVPSFIYVGVVLVGFPPERHRDTQRYRYPERSI